jgi:hypothetical protein
VFEGKQLETRLMSLQAIGETMKPMAIVTLEAGDSLDGNQQVKTFGWRSCQLQDSSERLLQSLSGWRRET